MRVAFVLLFVLFFSGLYSQKTKNIFSDTRITCEYETENGSLNGSYICKYSNGVKRSEGTFKNNVRSGLWTVYDSTGRKLHQRNYMDHLFYVRTYPEKEKAGAADLFDSSFYSLKKNENNYIEYFQLTERMVINSSRIWRELNEENNKMLFDKKSLYQIIFAYIIDSLNESYCSSTENFEKKMTIEEIKKFSEKDYKIISWKLKEDFIYDIERNVSETRIIGISPVGINMKTKDTTELYWVYFPMVRKALAKNIIPGKSKKCKLTFDDLFFFRNFSSEIYKVANVNNLKISDYCTTSDMIKSEQERIEISLIESEHEIWMGYLPH
jgi:hypothetical protein